MHEGYANNHLLFYPGAGLSDDEKGRMDRYEIPLDEISVDRLVYSMSRQIEANFQTFYSVAEDIVGEEAAVQIAHEIGRRYGGAGYARFLEAQGRAGAGEPRMMAL